MFKIHPKIKKKCPTCNKIFEVLWARRYRKYCSYECSKVDKIGRKHSKKWRKKQGKGLKGYKKTEEHIKKITEARKKNGTYIDSIDTKKRKSDSHKGNKNYNWRGGISFEPYSKEWTKELKQKIIARDKNICQLCGMTEKEQNKTDSLKRGLTVHHIDYNKKNCKEKNLTTLCRKCNSFVNYSRNYWMSFFKHKSRDNDIV